MPTTLSHGTNSKQKTDKTITLYYGTNSEQEARKILQSGLTLESTKQPNIRLYHKKPDSLLYIFGAEFNENIILNYVQGKRLVASYAKNVEDIENQNNVNAIINLIKYGYPLNQNNLNIQPTQISYKSENVKELEDKNIDVLNLPNLPNNNNPSLITNDQTKPKQEQKETEQNIFQPNNSNSSPHSSSPQIS